MPELSYKNYPKNYKKVWSKTTKNFFLIFYYFYITSKVIGCEKFNFFGFRSIGAMVRVLDMIVWSKTTKKIFVHFLVFMSILG